MTRGIIFRLIYTDIPVLGTSAVRRQMKRYISFFKKKRKENHERQQHGIKRTGRSSKN